MYYIAVKYPVEPYQNIMSEEYIPVLIPDEKMGIEWYQDKVSLDFHRRLVKIANDVWIYTVKNFRGDLGYKPVNYTIRYLDDGGIEISILLSLGVK